MARSAVCIGDPEQFASEMIKTINAKEYRLATENKAACCAVSRAMEASCCAVCLAIVMLVSSSAKRRKSSMLTDAFSRLGRRMISARVTRSPLYFLCSAFRDLQVRSISSNVRCSTVGRSQRSAGALGH